jgi:formylmethanofuran dehydrogenase subunit A
LRELNGEVNSNTKLEGYFSMSLSRVDRLTSQKATKKQSFNKYYAINWTNWDTEHSMKQQPAIHTFLVTETIYNSGHCLSKSQ